MNKKKIFIDTDPGHDDAIMLLIACYAKEFDILGVSSCSGNQTIEKTTNNLNNIMHFCHREDVPIAIGHPTPIKRKTRICAEIHGESGLDGYTFDKYDTHYESLEACDFIIKTLLGNEHVTVFTLGPMTNLGLAISKNKEILSHIDEIVLMGGSTGEGNITKEAEFNILVDPEAADICFNSGVKIRMLGLNVTRDILVTDEIVEKARKIKTRNADLFVKLMEVFNKNQREYFSLPAGPLHDPATIVSILNPKAFTFEDMNVRVDTSFSELEGKTYCTKEKPYNAKVAIDVNIKEYWKTVFKYLKYE